jgi:hypothetical protein
MIQALCSLEDGFISKKIREVAKEKLKEIKEIND